ncbi:hypothetical protein ACH3XW_3085 [Acanthocheilonema viteae]|uniref:Tudor domain-containing protein n=1 Tax=Acanthocheilonema viteae TaxID=6277 RepID=A0A498RZT0_ACAVI|nr:unnamed protein product [Acanthocheilonema viteae]
MPNGLMEHFPTGRLVAVLMGSLAFAVTYWYIRQQQNLKCESRNKKVNAKLFGQESFDVQKESKTNSKEDVAVSAVKQNDDITEPSDIVGDAALDSKFDRKNDVLVAELNNDALDANDVSVLEVQSNNLREIKKDPIDSLSHSDKVLIADEEALESSLVWKKSEINARRIYNTRRDGNAIDEQSSDSNMTEYRPSNTPSSEVHFFNQ